MTYFNDKLYLFLTFEEKIKYINRQKIPIEVGDYLIDRFKNLIISVPVYNQEHREDNILNLMFDGLLEGWCFETTESAIVFLDNYDYIERGNIYIDDNNPNYYHSWINFKYKNIMYVFDPSLNILCTRNTYIKLFNPQVISIISSMIVKDELINQFNRKMIYTSSDLADFIREKIPGFYKEIIKKNSESINIESSEDVNKPIYRNSSNYQLTIKNNMIKKLKVRYRYVSN